MREKANEHVLGPELDSDVYSARVAMSIVSLSVCSKSNLCADGSSI